MENLEEARAKAEVLTGIMFSLLWSVAPRSILPWPLLRGVVTTIATAGCFGLGYYASVLFKVPFKAIVVFLFLLMIGLTPKQTPEPGEMVTQEMATALTCALIMGFVYF